VPLFGRRRQLDRIFRRADRHKGQRVHEPPHVRRFIIAVCRQNRRLQRNDAAIDEIECRRRPSAIVGQLDGELAPELAVKPLNPVRQHFLVFWKRAPIAAPWPASATPLIYRFDDDNVEYKAVVIDLTDKANNGATLLGEAEYLFPSQGGQFTGGIDAFDRVGGFGGCCAFDDHRAGDGGLAWLHQPSAGLRLCRARYAEGQGDVFMMPPDTAHWYKDITTPFHYITVPVR
jgi:hypothetical protein